MDDWPSLVIEAGISESTARLMAAAHWWIENSKGEVRIVILIHLNSENRTIRILKCVPRPKTVPKITRSYNPSLPLPMMPYVDAEIIIDRSVSLYQITGAPLILEFAEVISRPPASPTENDVVFSAADLARWADILN